MRTIKFRAWDTERKEMLPVKLMDWAEWWVSCDPTHGQAKPLEYSERNSFSNERTDRHLLMQFTGLNDKNGVEIYEGDVLRVEGYKNMKVRWNDTLACFGIAFETGATSSIPLDVEIIGNIYENPEEALE